MAADDANQISVSRRTGKIAIGYLPTGQTGTTIPLGNDSRFPPTPGAAGAIIYSDSSSYLSLSLGTFSQVLRGGTAPTRGAVADGELAVSYIKADGTRAFTGPQDMGGFRITGLGTPSSSADAVTLLYMQNAISAVSRPSRPWSRRPTARSRCRRWGTYFIRTRFGTLLASFPGAR